MKVDNFPQDKLGNLIGKKGSHLQEFQTKSNVSIDINKGSGDIYVYGSFDDLDVASKNLHRVIDSVSAQVDLPETTGLYLASRKITKLHELQNELGNVVLHLNSHKTCTIRGLQADVDVATKVLMELKYVQQTLQLKDAETAYIIGKNGVTVEKLVATHQAAIQIDGQKDDKDVSKITVTGPVAAVEAAVAEIHELAVDAREGAERVPVSPSTKSLLLRNSGAAMKELHKHANAAVGKNVTLRLDDHDVVIRGKAMHLAAAKETVAAEVRRIEEAVVKIDIDPVLFSTLIGKGGETLKNIRADSSVDVVFDKSNGSALLIGSNDDEVAKVKAAIKEHLVANQVLRIRVDADMYQRQIKDVLRIKGKEVNELCSIAGDKELCHFVLRGDPEKIKQAEVIVRAFLDVNHYEELSVATEDLYVLMNGGEESKVVAIESENDVKITCSWPKQMLYIRGESAKVKNAVLNINRLLHGGDGWTATKLPFDEKALGSIIGKGGKTKEELQKKFESVSITVDRKESAVTIRGPPEAVEGCRIEILKLVGSAQTTQSIDLDEAKIEQLRKGRLVKDVMRDASVQITFKDNTVIVRGLSSNVDYAVAFLNESLYGFYESRFVLPVSHFSKVEESFREPTTLDRLKKASGAFIAIDSPDCSIVLRGKRDQVKIAKKELLSYLEFLLKPDYYHTELPGPLVLTIGKALNDIAATTGATIQLDRDIGVVFFFADVASIESAKAEVVSFINEASKNMFEIRLAPGDSWLVSKLVGSKGTRIQSLRKELKCKIVVDGHIITVQSEDAQLLQVAQQTLNEILESDRNKYVFVPISAGDLSAFIGRKGEHIKMFCKEHNIEVEIIETPECKLRLIGDEVNVAAGKAAAESWIATREENREKVRQDEAAVLSIKLRRNQIPGIIGAKGATIQGLEQEFGVRIKVDRESSVVTVRGGASDESRADTIARIKAIVAERDVAATGADTAAGPTLDAAEADEPKTKVVSYPTRTGRVKNDSPPPKTPSASPSQQESPEHANFPPLHNGLNATMATPDVTSVDVSYASSVTDQSCGIPVQ
jgi:rRNA processing protein Krr1/Pno1